MGESIEHDIKARFPTGLRHDRILAVRGSCQDMEHSGNLKKETGIALVSITIPSQLDLKAKSKETKGMYHHRAIIKYTVRGTSVVLRGGEQRQDND